MKVASYALVMTKVPSGSSLDPRGARDTQWGGLGDHLKVGQMKKVCFQTYPQRCSRVAMGDLSLGSTRIVGSF